MSDFPHVHVVDHPGHPTTADRRPQSHHRLRTIPALLGQIASLMAYELTRDYPTADVEVETPLAKFRGKRLAVDLTLVPVLRAGLGMTDGILQLFPEARVGHLGLYRDEETLEPVTYYNKLPPDIADTDVIIIDPMLATGGSLIAAIDYVQNVGARRIKILCLVASPEGIAAVRDVHPKVPIFTAAIDDCLNDKGYIVPGLGDAGDRIFGTA